MKFLKFIIIILFIAFQACSDTDSKKKEFLGIYKEILVAREIILDSAMANKEVIKILNKHGYEEPQFRQLYFELAQDRKAFIDVIDSAREWARREIDSINSENQTK